MIELNVEKAINFFTEIVNLKKLLKDFVWRTNVGKVLAEKRNNVSQYDQLNLAIHSAIWSYIWPYIWSYTRRYIPMKEDRCHGQHKQNARMTKNMATERPIRTII